MNLTFELTLEIATGFPSEGDVLGPSTADTLLQMHSCFVSTLSFPRLISTGRRRPEGVRVVGSRHRRPRGLAFNVPSEVSGDEPCGLWPGGPVGVGGGGFSGDGSGNWILKSNHSMMKKCFQCGGVSKSCRTEWKMGLERFLIYSPKFFFFC